MIRFPLKKLGADSIENVNNDFHRLSSDRTGAECQPRARRQRQGARGRRRPAEGSRRLRQEKSRSRCVRTSDFIAESWSTSDIGLPVFFSTLKSDDKAQMNRQYSSSFIVWMLIDGLNVSMAVDYEDYDTPRMGGGGGGVPAGGYTGAVIGVMTFVIVALIGAVVTMSLADWRRSHRPAADLHADVRKVVRHRTLRLPTPRQSHSRCWTRRCCLERRKPTGGTAPTSATRCRRAASRCTPRWPRRLAAAPPVPSRTTTATRPSSRPSTSNPSRSPRRRRSAPPAWVPKKKTKWTGLFFVPAQVVLPYGVS